MSKDHHVAWADRLGLNKLWFEDMKMCSLTFGSNDYPIMVARFENDIINIYKGPQLKKIVKKYKEEKLIPILDKEMQEWITNHQQLAQNPAHLRDKELELNKKQSILLCNYIIQILEDNGFCFYQSDIVEDEMK